MRRLALMLAGYGGQAKHVSRVRLLAVVLGPLAALAIVRAVDPRAATTVRHAQAHVWHQVGQHLGLVEPEVSELKPLP